MQGWIKVSRKLLENPLARKPAWAWLWIVLLLKASHKETNMILNGKIVLIKEGQLVTGRDALSKDSGIHRSSVDRILNFLEIEHQIEQHKTTKYRLITIVNWNEYQERASNRATTEQQMSTIKKDKKEKKEETADAVFTYEDENAKPPRVIDPSKNQYEKLCRWAEKRRGFPFVNRKKQYASLRDAKAANISLTRLKNRWCELEGETWRDGFDWASVVSSFNKKA